MPQGHGLAGVEPRDDVRRKINGGELRRPLAAAAAAHVVVDAGRNIRRSRFLVRAQNMPLDGSPWSDAQTRLDGGGRQIGPAPPPFHFRAVSRTTSPLV